MTKFRSAYLGHSFGIKVLLAVLIIAAGDVLFYQHWISGANFGLFALCWLFGLLAARPNMRRSASAMLSAGLAALFAAAMIIYPTPLAWALFWCAISMAALLPATARFDDAWRWFQRLSLHAIRALFAPMIDVIKFLRVKRRKPKANMRKILPNLALPVAGGGIIILLFASANPIIDRFLASVHLPQPSAELILRMLFWVGLLIAVWGTFRPKMFRHILGTFDGSGDMFIPGVTIMSVKLSLLLFNLLFIAQNALDVLYLWSGQGTPDGISLAQYAHRGAYPLIVTALLAGLFVIVTLRPGSATAAVPVIRNMVVLWIAQNLFLVASSMLRTWDYIEAYSLTQWRIAAMAWMALVAVGLILVVWRMLMGRSASWLINRNMCAALALLTGFAFIDTGAAAAHWNVRHAKEVGGRGTYLDVYYLKSLGTSSLLPLIELEKRLGDSQPELSARVRCYRQELLSDMIDDESNGYWTLRAAFRLQKAREILGKDMLKGYQPYERECSDW